MADLYNLDAEITEQQDELSSGVVLSQEEEAEEWDESNAEQVSVLSPSTSQQQGETDDGVVDRMDLEDVAQTAATTHELMYTRLYNAWVQERQSPELLPFPTDIVAQMREEIADVDEVDTGNMNLDGLLESILFIDKERVKFLLADLLTRRLKKIQAFPNWMTGKTDRMSPQEKKFWLKYKDLYQTHMMTSAMLPEKDGWRNLESDTPELSHAFCFAECCENVKIKGRDMLEGNRIIVRYEHIREFIEQGKVVLV